MTAPLKHTPPPPIDPAEMIAAERKRRALKKCSADTRAAMRDIPARSAIEFTEAVQKMAGVRVEDQLRDQALWDYHLETGKTPREISIALTRYHASAWTRGHVDARTLPESLQNHPNLSLWYALKFKDQLLEERRIRQIINSLRRQ